MVEGVAFGFDRPNFSVVFIVELLFIRVHHSVKGFVSTAVYGRFIFLQIFFLSLILTFTDNGSAHIRNQVPDASQVFLIVLSFQ